MSKKPILTRDNWAKEFQAQYIRRFNRKISAKIGEDIPPDPRDRPIEDFMPFATEPTFGERLLEDMRKKFAGEPIDPAPTETHGPADMTGRRHPRT